MFVSSSFDKTMKVWDTETLKVRNVTCTLNVMYTEFPSMQCVNWDICSINLVTIELNEHINYMDVPNKQVTIGDGFIK